LKSTCPGGHCRASATDGEILLKEFVGPLQVAERREGLGEAIHRLEGAGVVVAQHAPIGSQGLLVKVSGVVEIAQGSAGLGEVVHRVQGVGVIIAEDLAAGDKGLLK
jgi:hypothetical protein